MNIQLFQHHFLKRTRDLALHMLELLSKINQVGPFMDTIDQHYFSHWSTWSFSPLFCYFGECSWTFKCWTNLVFLDKFHLVIMSYSFLCSWTHFANIWLRILAKPMFLKDINLQFSFLIIPFSWCVIGIMLLVSSFSSFGKNWCQSRIISLLNIDRVHPWNHLGLRLFLWEALVMSFISL